MQPLSASHAPRMLLGQSTLQKIPSFVLWHSSPSSPRANLGRYLKFGCKHREIQKCLTGCRPHCICINTHSFQWINKEWLCQRSQKKTLQIPQAQLLQWLQWRNKTTLPSLAPVDRRYKSNKTGILLGCFHPSVLPAGRGPVFFCYGYGWSSASFWEGSSPFWGPLLPLLQLTALQPSCTASSQAAASSPPAVSHWLGPLLPGGGWEFVSRSSHLIQTKHLQGNVSESRKPELKNRVSGLCCVLANFSLIFCPDKYAATHTEK